jgi:ABC-type multidrug transport system ATPase subunit
VEYSSGATWQKVGNWLNQNLFRCVWVECCYDPESCCGRKKAAKYAKLDEDEDFVDMNQMPVTEIEDDDVRAERVECDTGLRSLEMVNRHAANNVENDAVLAAGIHMEYPPSGMQRYEGTVAVKDFSLRIKKKECFALLGSNGAGKTTVMAILLKQLQLTKGNIFVNGVQILDVADSVAKTMSYCPQHNALFESLTSRECLEFYCRIRGVPEEKLPVYVQQWLEASDLKDHEHTWCGALSGGNKRKLSLAISLVGNPEFIVLDEPSAGVDPAARRKLHWLINATKRRGATLVLTTHHMDEASILGDRVGIMVKGYLTCVGTVQHLLHKYSNGYLLSAFMYPEYSISDELLPVLREICPNLKVGASSGTQFCSIVLGNAQEFSISKLYATMQQLQQQKKVEYFSCGQSRLEDVFLTLSDKFVRKKNPIGVAPSNPAAGGGDLRGNASVSSIESHHSAGLSMKNPILHSPENLTEI